MCGAGLSGAVWISALDIRVHNSLPEDAAQVLRDETSTTLTWDPVFYLVVNTPKEAGVCLQHTCSGSFTHVRTPTRRLYPVHGSP